MEINGKPQPGSWGETKSANPNVKYHSIPIFVGRKVVGRVYGETFVKEVHSSKHFLKYPRAIAFDISSLKAAWEAGARIVEVRDKDTRRVYRADIAYIRENGFCFDRGHGKQIGLPLYEWERKNFWEV